MSKKQVIGFVLVAPMLLVLLGALGFLGFGLVLAIHEAAYGIATDMGLPGWTGDVFCLISIIGVWLLSGPPPSREEDLTNSV